MDIYLSSVAAGFGLIIGSFLNCLIWRLYKQESILGRSYCPACRHLIAWFDNIPVVSFLRLRGRCRHCQAKIYWQYPLVEIITAMFFWGLWQLHGANVILMPTEAVWSLLRDLLVVIFLIVVFVYDARWQLVPTFFVGLMGGLIFILNFYLGISWLSLLIYGVAGGGFFLIQYILTRRQGVGEGDIWLGVFLGLAFPHWPSLFLIVLVAYGLGAIVGLSLMAFRRKGWKSAIALGPFLAVGGAIALFFGDKIIYWYQGLLF